ncbi:MAG: 3-hydroxyacyl-CoA dehydrogenase family protein [Thermoanaerobaculia bacterium]
MIASASRGCIASIGPQDAARRGDRGHRHLGRHDADAVAEFARKLGDSGRRAGRTRFPRPAGSWRVLFTAEAMWLLDERHRVEAIDRAMVTWGMPMGPLRLADEVGLDVSAKVGHILHEAFPDRLQFPPGSIGSRETPSGWA